VIIIGGITVMIFKKDDEKDNSEVIDRIEEISDKSNRN
jgi:hypothetical protein